MKAWRIDVQRRGFMYYAVVGVIVDDDGTETCEDIETGLFTRGAAEKSQACWNQTCLESEVADAEREAGWDSNL